MCKGGTFPRKQVNIASVRKLGPAMYSVPLTLVKEPDKPVDKNAVKFVANVGGVDRSLGYAGVFEIPWVLNAMNKSEIANVQINYVKATFRRAINKSLFDMACTVTKRGRWEPSDKIIKRCKWNHLSSLSFLPNIHDQEVTHAMNPPREFRAIILMF